MTIPVSAISSARQQATAARTEARPQTLAPGRPATLRIARVTAVRAHNSYDVALLDDLGNATVAVVGLRSVPVIDLAVNALCWVVTWDGNPVPCILGASGGGSNDWGVVTD